MTNEDVIDSLLRFMNDEIEKDGHLIENFRFYFLEDQRDAFRFMERYHISPVLFQTALNCCLSRKLICRDPEGGEIQLTETGQQQAISTKQEECENNSTEALLKEFLNEANDEEKAEIENALVLLITKIKHADTTPQQKSEAQKILQELITHPLVNTILGASEGLLASLLGG